MSSSLIHISRLMRWGRTLARHGALRGIENDPLTPPNIRRLLKGEEPRIGGRKG